MSNIKGQAWEFFDDERIVVTDTNVGLTEATFAPTSDSGGKGPAQYALLTLETDQIRYRFSGANADANSHLLGSGSSLELYGIDNIRGFRAVRVTANANLTASYGRLRK